MAPLRVLLLQAALVGSVRVMDNLSPPAALLEVAEQQPLSAKKACRLLKTNNPNLMKSECIAAVYSAIPEKYWPEDAVVTDSMRCEWVRGQCIAKRTSMCPYDFYGYDARGKCRVDSTNNNRLDWFAKTLCCETGDCPHKKYGYDAEHKCRADIDDNGILDRFAKKTCCRHTQCPHSLYGFDENEKCKADSDNDGTLDTEVKAACCSQTLCEHEKYGYDSEGRCKADSTGSDEFDMFTNDACCVEAGAVPAEEKNQVTSGCPEGKYRVDWKLWPSGAFCKLKEITESTWKSANVECCEHLFADEDMDDEETFDDEDEDTTGPMSKETPEEHPCTEEVYDDTENGVCKNKATGEVICADDCDICCNLKKA